MGQSWQKPEGAPRLGKLEVWVERARNLAPELEQPMARWADATVKVVLLLKGRGEERYWRTESESKVPMSVGGRIGCAGGSRPKVMID
jgi:hypothetical protein